MRKPCRYDDKVHSFFNSVTGRGLNKFNVCELLKKSKVIKSNVTNVMAIILYDYYCEINTERKKPGNFNTVVGEYVKQLG